MKYPFETIKCEVDVRRVSDTKLPLRQPCRSHFTPNRQQMANKKATPKGWPK